ncbi:MAG TPA: asparagine synthase (glutamine-hydrolyzing) [Burkholderiales bacterium]|nr:asparagine synthase (glutamine-hydrolyzing) [Burkholderiales bacterium]
MCGIAGYYSRDVRSRGTGSVLAMLRAISHRGPDDQGIYFADLRNGSVRECSTSASDAHVRQVLPLADSVGQQFPHDVAFAHCRYSIVDLTPGGHQPMHDPSGQVHIVFNGEIYNFIELRQELEGLGHRFRSQSDTEVLLTGYLEWGTGVFCRLNGQWALALHDLRTDGLLLSRDRMGKVPLYYAVRDGRFYFASEIKAIIEVCGNVFPVRSQAIDDYVVEGRRDCDGTFWEHIHDFPAASYAWVKPDLTVATTRYWQLPSERMRGQDIGPDEAAASLREQLVEAIRVRVRADVPVAFELSGGTDSSALVALATSRLLGSLTAYSVEFFEPKHNEEPYARAVAERFGPKIDYRVIRPRDDDFWRDADQFIWIEEEPFHSPNLHTNQSLRRQMKAEGSKVVISGAAGDEVLAGYADEYLVPYLRGLAGSFQWARLLKEARANTERPISMATAPRLVLEALSPAWERQLRRARSGEAALLAGCYLAPKDVKPRLPTPASFDARMRSLMAEGRMNYWLRSANKSNFGIPIEPRAPYLDYHVVEFAFRLPPEYLIRDGWHKWILREALRELLPEEVLWRKRKMGFPYPLGAWLRASRALVDRNIAESSCPYIDHGSLMVAYERFSRVAPATLWRLVNLGLWWKRVIDRDSIVTALKA